jgi:AmmeMemoRadiSam system protein B/AmmeMemoRadiSam system protein A
MNKAFGKLNIRKILPYSIIMLLCIFGLLLTGSCEKETPTPAKTTTEIPKEETMPESAKTVLHSSLAEMGWYTADPNTLRGQIDNLFNNAQTEPIENVVALILPHAGYRYSGQTAVTGLKTLNKKYQRIVVIGPSHRVSMGEMLSVPRATHYQTPLGQIPLDTDFINELLKYPFFQNVPQAHQYEHSVQIELPLLQEDIKDFKLVPIVAGQCSLETIEKAAAVLAGLVDEKTLVIASSDFTHYGSSYEYTPFSENIPENIKKLTMGAYQYIAALDAKGFLEYKERTGATICGFVPIAVLLSMLDESSQAHLIQYADSSQQSGDYSNCVSYLSIAFSGKWKISAKIAPKTNNLQLTEQDKQQLLILAKKTIDYAVKNRKVPQVSELGVTISDSMTSPRAAFVTLKKNNLLRGCIGDIFPRQPLYMSVLINAINACFNDTRFPQVTEDDLGDITIEISALTVPQPIASPDQIRIGIDGVILNKNGHTAVFLPQVAPEQGWNVAQMLTQLSLKAGLPADAWKEGASFQVFQAVVFGENEK